MKLKTIIAVILIGYAPAYGQMAHWVIPMDYDELRVEENGLIVTGKIGDKTHIYYDKGINKEANANDVVHPFREGRAVATQLGSDVITAVYMDNGKIQSYKNRSLQLAYDIPYFYDGFLLAKDNDLFCFVSKDGYVSGYRYVSAYPYRHGYAACQTYANIKNMKDPYYIYLDNEGNVVSLTIKGKQVDKEDIAFVSSINDELQGFVVVKGDVYIFDAQNGELKPLYGNTVEKGKQRQAEVKDKYMFIQAVEDKTNVWCLAARTKNDDIYVFFDRLMTPTCIINGNDTTYFRKNVVKNKEPMSKLKIIRNVNNDSLGLTYEGKEFLPPQFKDIRILEGDKALVCKDTKWGIMGVIPNFNLRENIKINDGKEIGFRHKNFNTSIRLDLPKEISAKKTRILKVGKSGIHEIDQKSRAPHDTEDGNYLTCDCKLDIPEEITDSVTTPIEYPVMVEYDNFHSPVIPLTTKVWHVKYLGAIIDQDRASMVDGDYTFYIDVTVDKEFGEGDTKFDVWLEADTLYTDETKINETLYSGIIKDLPEGTTTFYIVFQEEGCPQTVVPIDVTYNKPSPKDDDTPPNKQVSIRKTKKTVSRKPKPKPKSKPKPTPSPKPIQPIQIEVGI